MGGVQRCCYLSLPKKLLRKFENLLVKRLLWSIPKAKIIAATNQERIGIFHEGAFITSQKKEKLIITEKEVPQLKGVKAGINLPIFFQDEVIGVIGITGDPETVTPFGEIIRKMTELLISENYYAEQFDWHTRAMEAFVMEWLQSKEPNPALADRARTLSINLEVNRTAAIVEFDPTDKPLIVGSLVRHFKFIFPKSTRCTHTVR